MKKTLIRVYDKNDQYANFQKRYFVVLEDESDEEIEYVLTKIASMRWQNYTSYIIGTADIEEDELYWSEIMGYEMKEIKIDINRVKINGNYKLPQCLRGE